MNEFIDRSRYMRRADKSGSRSWRAPRAHPDSTWQRPYGRAKAWVMVEQYIGGNQSDKVTSVQWPDRRCRQPPELKKRVPVINYSAVVFCILHSAFCILQHVFCSTILYRGTLYSFAEERRTTDRPTEYSLPVSFAWVGCPCELRRATIFRSR